MNNAKDGFIPDSAVFNRRDFALAVSTTAAGAATAALWYSGSAGAWAETASVVFTNLNLSYRIKQLTSGQPDVYLNVQNLFNQVPPLTAFFGMAPNPGQFGGFALGDDPTGRAYAVGVRLKL